MHYEPSFEDFNFFVKGSLGEYTVQDSGEYLTTLFGVSATVVNPIILTGADPLEIGYLLLVSI